MSFRNTLITIGAIKMTAINEISLTPDVLKNVHVLVVDNDQGSQELYTFVLKTYGANVTAIGSVKEALDFLDWYIPTVLICEMRFLGETVYPLIQRVRHLALGDSRTIPVMVISTCPSTCLTDQLQLKIEAYLIKPIDLDQFIREVWNLAQLSIITILPIFQGRLMEAKTKQLSRCSKVYSLS